MRGRMRSGRGTTGAAAAGAVALVLLTATGAHAEGKGDIRVVKTVVNGGKGVVLGTSGTVKYSMALTITDNSGVKGVSRISAFSKSTLVSFGDLIGSSCAKKSPTKSVCTLTMAIEPRWIADSDQIDSNRNAGVWTVSATVNANDGDYWISDGIAEFKMQRASALTTDATPEPVAKGAKLTITGKLTRANWEDRKYYGFSGQQAQLQFKKAGAASYRTVKTVQSATGGKLTTKVTATAAGRWRWVFPGTTTTARVVSVADSVSLK